MFDVGFLELLFVGIIALLVLGPERLPVAVRTVGLTIGRIKRGFADVKAQVEREIGADEIRQQLHNERILANLEKGKTAEPNADKDENGENESTPGKPVSNVKRNRQQTVTPPEQTAAAEPTGEIIEPAVTESQPRPNE